MSKMEAIIKSEIQRLAKREIYKTLAPLAQDIRFFEKQGLPTSKNCFTARTIYSSSARIIGDKRKNIGSITGRSKGFSFFSSVNSKPP